MSDTGVKEISVFVDESGSFESDESSSRYYLICILLHDQATDISGEVARLEDSLSQTEFGSGHCIHVGPLIRREACYANVLREDRQTIFRSMMAFVRRTEVSYRCFLVDKHFTDGDHAVFGKLLQSINSFLSEQYGMLSSCTRLKIYYDGGQEGVSLLLHEAFEKFSAIVQFVPGVKPENYRLFQAADLLCSIELVAAKIESGFPMTASEMRFFGSERNFRRNILRSIRRKAI